jgi:tryptophan-rich sensory protein
MATFTAVTHNFSSLLDADRHDGIGAGLSAALPLMGLVVAYGAAEAMGVQPVLHAPLGLPEWTGALALAISLPLWGAARWLVAEHGHEGRAAARWIVALMVASILAPFMLTVADPFMSTVVSMVLMLIGLAAAGRAASVSGRACLLVLPGLAWLGLGAVLGFGVVAGGWSPPFAVTQDGDA